MIGKIKRVSLNLLLVLFSIVIALIIAELGLRLYYFHSFDTPAFYYLTPLLEAHPLYGWIYRPSLRVNLHTLDYATAFSTNSRGFHDIEHQYEKDPKTYRIVVLGDSFMDAYQVNFEDSLTQLLGAGLKGRKVEVINLSIRAYGTAQQLLLLKNEGLKYNPDLIILSFFSLNDIYDNSSGLNSHLWGEEAWQFFSRPYFYGNNQKDESSFKFPDFKVCDEFFTKKQDIMKNKLENKTFFEKTVLLHLIELYKQQRITEASIPPYDPNILYGVFLKRFDPAIFPSNNMSIQDYEELWQEAWDITCKLILEIQKTAKVNGADFVLLNIPAKIQVEEEYFKLAKDHFPTVVFDLESSNRHLMKFAGLNNINYLDLLPSFIEYTKNHNHLLFHKRIDRHWNKKGHRLATDVLIKYLETKKIFPN